MKRLLLAGAGNAHLEVLRRLSHRRPGADVTLVTPDARVLYSGMVPGLIAGQYSRADCEIDVARLAGATGITLHIATIAAVDTQTRRATCSDGRQIPFDILSINTGSAALPETPDGNPALLPIRPLSGFVDEYERRIAKDGKSPVVIVGGGPAAIEIALAMRERMRGRLTPTENPLTIVTDSNDITPRFPRAVQSHLATRCRDAGIDIVTGTRIVSIDGILVAAHGRIFHTDVAWWAGGAVASPWFRESGLSVDDSGFIRVDAALQSVSHPGIFAAGEAASVEERGRLHSGVHAVRQGPVLADNLLAALAGAALRRYAPQRFSLAIMRTSRCDAIAAYGPLSAHGSWVWRWKDRIDRRYVASFGDA